MKLGYLGPAGTFTEEATIRYDPTGEHVPFPSHQAVFRALLDDAVDGIVVARENSIGGSVIEVIDPMISGLIGLSLSRRTEPSFGRLMLCGEVLLPIEQCLYQKRGDRTPTKEIEVIFSHPQGLAQCAIFISSCCPKAKLVETPSTVAAIPDMLGSSVPALAIAPRRAAALFPEAELCEGGIQDKYNNVTRFVVIGKEDCALTGRDKTSICFTVPGDEQAGAFDRVSQIFACCGINKRLVESRPQKTALGRYVFLMDLDGHRHDRVLKLAFELIVAAGLATSFYILGSYPREEVSGGA